MGTRIRQPIYLFMVVFIVALSSYSVVGGTILEYKFSDNLDNEYSGLGLAAVTPSYVSDYPVYNLSGNGSFKSYDAAISDNVLNNNTFSTELDLENFTIRLWYRADVNTVSGDAYLFRVYFDGNNFISFRRESTDQRIYSMVRDNSVYYMDTPVSPDLTNNQEWQHLVLTVEKNSTTIDSTCRFYINSVLNATDRDCRDLARVEPVALTIGAYSTSLFAQGYLDEFKIDDIAWNSTEVKADFNTGNITLSSEGTPEPPVANYNDMLVIPFRSGDSITNGLISYWNMTGETDYLNNYNWSFDQTQTVSSGCMFGSCQMLNKTAAVGGYFNTTGLNTVDYSGMSLGFWADPRYKTCTGDNEYFFGVNSQVGNEYFYGKRGCQETVYQRDKYNQKYKVGGVTISSEYANLTEDWSFYVAVWYSNNTCRTYINGTLEIEDPTCKGWDDLAASPIVMFGGYLPEAGEYGFNGLMDEMYLMGRAQTETEILEIYNNGLGNDTWYKIPQDPSLNYSINLTTEGGFLCGWDGSDNIPCETYSQTPDFTFNTAGVSNCSLTTVPVNYSSVTSPTGWNCTPLNSEYHSCSVGDNLPIGTTEVYVSCQVDGLEMDKFNTTNVFNVTVYSLDSIDPVISSVSPAPPNGSVVNYSFSVVGSASDVNLEYVSLELFYPNSTRFYLFEGSSWSTELDVSPVFGAYTLRIFANDSYSNTAREDYFFYVNDSLDPVCSGFGDQDPEPGSVYTWAVNCADDGWIDSFNISCSGADNYNISQVGTNSSNLYFNQSYGFNNGSSSCLYEVCDYSSNCLVGFQEFTVEEGAAVPVEDDGFNEFSSVPQALFYIFLYLVWFAFLILTFIMRGKSGNTIQLFNLFQVFLGVIIGAKFFYFSAAFGLITIVAAAVVFIFKAVESF